MDTSIDPIIFLKNEHESIRAVLNNLEGYLKKLGSGGSDGLKDNLLNQLNEVTAFIDNDLEIHFKREEEGLFPVLGNYMGIETGPIHVMLIEHKNCRELSNIFKTNINNCLADKNYKAVISAGNSLASLLSEHEDKEDNILFNMANMHLSKDEKQSIMEKMATIK